MTILYIDPGTGSMLFSILIGIVGTLVFFGQQVILGTMCLQLLHGVFEGTHLFLVTKHFHHIATRHYPQFWEQCLYHLHVLVCRSVECEQVGFVEYYMFFYHPSVV